MRLSLSKLCIETVECSVLLLTKTHLLDILADAFIVRTNHSLCVSVDEFCLVSVHKPRCWHLQSIEWHDIINEYRKVNFRIALG